MEWSDVTQLHSLLGSLETQNCGPAGSNDNEDNSDQDYSMDEIKKAVEYLNSHFRIPLESKGISLEAIQDEVEEIVYYARGYLEINRVYF